MEAREILARAISREHSAMMGEPYDESFPITEIEFGLADVGLAALAEAGLVVVPKEPTSKYEAALREAQKLAQTIRSNSCVAGYDCGHAGIEKTAKQLLATIAAALPQLEGQKK